MSHTFALNDLLRHGGSVLSARWMHSDNNEHSEAHQRARVEGKPADEAQRRRGGPFLTWTPALRAVLRYMARLSKNREHRLVMSDYSKAVTTHLNIT